MIKIDEDKAPKMCVIKTRTMENLEEQILKSQPFLKNKTWEIEKIWSSGVNQSPFIVTVEYQ